MYPMLEEEIKAQVETGHQVLRSMFSEGDFPLRQLNYDPDTAHTIHIAITNTYQMPNYQTVHNEGSYTGFSNYGTRLSFGQPEGDMVFTALGIDPTLYMLRNPSNTPLELVNAAERIVALKGLKGKVTTNSAYEFLMWPGLNCLAYMLAGSIYYTQRFGREIFIEDVVKMQNLPLIRRLGFYENFEVFGNLNQRSH